MMCFVQSAEPSQQPPPKYEPIDSHTMRLYWQPPDNPNGIITFYNLYRDGKEVAKIYPPGTFSIGVRRYVTLRLTGRRTGDGRTCIQKIILTARLAKHVLKDGPIMEEQTEMYTR